MAINGTRQIKNLMGRVVVLPLGGESVRGKLKDVRGGWIILEECHTRSGPVDGELWAALPIPWIQAVP